MDRVILHIDMDAFFASIEQACQPRLKGKPLIVGSRGRRDNTVVAACSYEAKAFGVQSGMPTFRAFQLCPHALFVPADSAKYLSASRLISGMLQTYAERMEAASIDEFYLDLSACGFEGAASCGRRIKDQVRRQLGVTCSVGIAAAKIIAKVAAKARKPDGLLVLRPEQTAAFLDPLPIGRIPGIGPRLEEHLHNLSVFTCGQLAACDPAMLVERFGKSGIWLHDVASGRDDSEVPYWSDPDAPPKSISHSYTLESEISDRDVLCAWIRMLCEMVAYRLRKEQREAQVVHFYCHGSVASGAVTGAWSKQKSFGQATSDGQLLFERCLRILRQMPQTIKSCRALGVSVSGLELSSGLALLPQDAKRKSIIGAQDRINERFGDWSIYPASLGRIK